MRIGLQNGVWTGVLGLAGTGAIMIWPTQTIIGAMLLGAALLLAIWGLKIDGRHWWKRLDQPVATSKWQPLHFALRYIALESEWAHSVPPAPAGEMNNLLERVVSEHLARGEVKARGREVISDAPFRLTAASVPIPPDFWPTAFFQAFGEIVLGEDERGAASRNGSFSHVPKSAYREVVLDIADVKRVWPPMAKVVKLKTPFHYALINHYRGQLMRDDDYASDNEMWVANGRR